MSELVMLAILEQPRESLDITHTGILKLVSRLFKRINAQTYAVSLSNPCALRYRPCGFYRFLKGVVLDWPKIHAPRLALRRVSSDSHITAADAVEATFEDPAAMQQHGV